MKERNSFFGMFVVLAILYISLIAHVTLAQDEGSCRIAGDDVLQITITDHPELSVTAIVIADGTVSLPLVGSVRVEGMVVEEARLKLEELYNQHYIANPSVAINLTKSRSKQFYIYGEVQKPGSYPLISHITVLKAIVTAGGFTDFSRKSGVKVLRKMEGKKQTIKVNVGKIESGKLDRDIELQADDIIIIPEKLI